MADDLEAALLGQVLYAELPDEEPIMRWWRWADGRPTHAQPQERELRVRVGDNALLIGRCEYHCLTDGQVEVKDYTDPRSMRYQRYTPGRPQPYMAPHFEDRDPGPA
jgi:hypothetical protein